MEGEIIEGKAKVRKIDGKIGKVKKVTRRKVRNKNTNKKGRNEEGNSIE
jgi:hypothetical protein